MQPTTPGQKEQGKTIRKNNAVYRGGGEQVRFTTKGNQKTDGLGKTKSFRRARVLNLGRAPIEIDKEG